MTDGFPQPTPKLIQRMRRHAKVLRALSRDLRHGPGLVGASAFAAMANVNDQAAGRLEDFLTAHGSDVRPASEGK